MRWELAHPSLSAYSRSWSNYCTKWREFKHLGVLKAKLGVCLLCSGMLFGNTFESPGYWIASLGCICGVDLYWHVLNAIFWPPVLVGQNLVTFVLCLAGICGSVCEMLSTLLSPSNMGFKPATWYDANKISKQSFRNLWLTSQWLCPFFFFTLYEFSTHSNFTLLQVLVWLDPFCCFKRGHSTVTIWIVSIKSAIANITKHKHPL